MLFLKKKTKKNSLEKGHRHVDGGSSFKYKMSEGTMFYVRFTMHL